MQPDIQIPSLHTVHSWFVETDNIDGTALIDHG